MAWWSEYRLILPYKFGISVPLLQQRKIWFNVDFEEKTQTYQSGKMSKYLDNTSTNVNCAAYILIKPCSREIHTCRLGGAAVTRKLCAKRRHLKNVKIPKRLRYKSNHQGIINYRAYLIMDNIDGWWWLFCRLKSLDFNIIRNIKILLSNLQPFIL